jgi:cobalt transporter subunit CbtA
MILEAEKYEAPSSDHTRMAVQPESVTAAANALAEAAESEWAPASGLERTLYTTLTAVVAGAAFAAILAGISLISGVPITAQNGVIWGLCGFLAATLAPAAGLPPELPGMPAGDLATRQLWWVGCIAATGIGIYLIYAKRHLWGLIAAVALIAVPHLIGAPQASPHESGVPAGLAAAFSSNSIAAGAAFWAVLGTLLGLTLDKLAVNVEPV